MSDERNRVQHLAAPKLSDEDVKTILSWCVSNEIDVESITLTRRDAESLAQEVLDARSAEKINDGLLKRYERLVKTFEEKLLHAAKRDKTRAMGVTDEILDAWTIAKKGLTEP